MTASEGPLWLLNIVTYSTTRRSLQEFLSGRTCHDIFAGPGHGRMIVLTFSPAIDVFEELVLPRALLRALILPKRDRGHAIWCFIGFSISFAFGEMLLNDAADRSGDSLTIVGAACMLTVTNC